MSAEMRTPQIPYKLFVCDTTGIDKGVLNRLDTRYLLPGRGIPDEFCSPFDLCASQVISWP